MTRKVLYCSTVIAGFCLGFTPGVSCAQGAAPTPQASALEEVVVTARRREERLQTTPVAVTAVTSEALERRNVVNLFDVSKIVPSLAINPLSGSLGSAGVFMRGIGYTDTAVGQDSPLGIYLDGVNVGRTNVALMDLVEPDRVEVLRGPQGTLFGRNTTAGAILITTHTPSDQFGGMAKASYGTYGATRLQTRIDSGLIGDSGMKLTLGYQHRRQNGIIDNATASRDRDPGNENSDNWFLKAVGDWGPLQASLSADYSELSGIPQAAQIVDATAAVRTFVALSPSYGGNGYLFSRSASYDTPNSAANREQRIWSHGLALTLNYELSDNLAIKSISSTRAFKRNDPSGNGPADLRGNVGTAAAPRIVSFNGLFDVPRRQQAQRQYSQEIQLLGNVQDFDFVAGAYFYKEKAWDFSINRLPFVAATGLTASEVNTIRLVDIDSKSKAAFAQVDWAPAAFDKKLELSGGVRWTKDKREFVQSQGVIRSADLETTNTSYLGSVKYQWSDNIMTFVRYSTGYRAGGFNARAVAAVDPVYQPEKLKVLEGGVKADFFDKRLRVNASAYHSRYRNLQVTQFVPQDPLGGGGNQTVNANAKYDGFELEVQAAPVEGLTLTATYGYVKPKYTSFPRALDAGRVSPGCTPLVAVTGTTVGQDCAAIAEFTYFPKKTGDASIRYEFPAEDYGTWSVFLAYQYRGRTEMSQFDLPSTPFQDVVAAKAYGIVNGRIALSDIPIGAARAELALFGNNLLNKDYNAQGIDFGSFAAVIFGVPRTVGLEGRIEF